MAVEGCFKSSCQSGKWWFGKRLQGTVWPPRTNSWAVGGCNKGNRLSPCGARWGVLLQVHALWLMRALRFVTWHMVHDWRTRPPQPTSRTQLRLHTHN